MKIKLSLMLGIIAAIFAYFLFALGNIFEKILRSTDLKSPFTLVLLNGIATLPLLLIPVFHNVNTTDYLSIALSILAGALSTAGFIPYLIAVKKEEASRLVSLWSLAPIITILLAFFILHESLPPNFYLAFGVISLGGLLMSANHLKGNLSAHGFYLMILSNFLYSLAAILSKYVFISLGFLDFIFYVVIGHTIISLSLLILNTTRTVVISDIGKIKNKGLLLLYFFAVLIAWPLYLLSIQLLPVSIAIVLGGMQGAFVFLLALFLSFRFPATLKENIGKEAIAIKIISILLMLIGLYILQI